MYKFIFKLLYYLGLHTNQFITIFIIQLIKYNILFFENSMHNQKIDELRRKLIKLLKLQNIDEHESLTFLKRNHGIKPSQIILAVTMMIVLLLLILDGCGILSSIICFVLPCLGCLQQLAKAENQSKSQPLKISSQNQNSQYTDEQFSQLISHSKAKTEVIEVYTIYFAFYIATEIITPFMNYLLGSIPWLIIRSLASASMILTKKNQRLCPKILQFIKKRQDSSNRKNSLLMDI